MHFWRRGSFIARNTVLVLVLFPVMSFGQQIVQRGPFGKPAQVLDETMQWSTPLLVSGDHDVEMYIPDVTSPEWMKRNYPGFQDKGQYVLSMFTFYKTPEACRANQIGWGFSDAAHLDACTEIGYRVRQALVDTQQKTVTLMMAAMIDQDGQIEPGSIQRQTITRTWHELDANTQGALEKTNGIVSKQMKIYDTKMQSLR
jgi:hypothetical protein